VAPCCIACISILFGGSFRHGGMECLYKGLCGGGRCGLGMCMCVCVLQVGFGGEATEWVWNVGQRIREVILQLNEKGTIEKGEKKLGRSKNVPLASKNELGWRFAF